MVGALTKNNVESYQEILRLEGESITRLAERLDFGVMDAILELFCRTKESGRKVILAGCGTAGTAARRIAHTLNVVEIPALFLSPADSIHGGFGVIQQGDVVVLVSKSGNTGEILHYVPVARTKGATTIGVTENRASKLGQGCDIVLEVKVDREPDIWGLVSSNSMLAVIAAFDAIVLTTMRYTGFSKEQFFLIHSGGGVGDILSKEFAPRDPERPPPNKQP